MPIYEFRCMKCNNEFEHLVFNSNESVICPGCNEDKVKRVMSACRYKSSGGGSYTPSSPSSGSSGCSGCSSSDCSTCH